MNTDTLIRFYVNNGTEKTIEMLKENHSDGLLKYIIHHDIQATAWAKEVAQYLLDELYPHTEAENAQ